jgi:membrane protein
MAGVVDRVKGVLREQRSRRPWLDHLIRAYQQYKDANGDHLAAAITYFSFLAIFPLVLLAASVTGYVLANNEDLRGRLLDAITENVPGSLGDTLSGSVDSIIDNKGSIGIIALLGVAYAGLGWVGNLRKGVQVVWACEPTEEKFLKAKAGDALVLVGLGLGIVVSLALTSGGTAASKFVVEALGVDGITGMGTLIGAIGILLAVAADTLLFMWLFVRLPRRPVRYKTVLRGALIAAVGYEVLKIAGATYIAGVAANPTYGSFATAVGLLIWIDLVSRFLLLAAAWTATGKQPEGSDACGDPEPEPGFTVDVDDRPTAGVVGPVPAGTRADGREPARPAAVAGALVGTGALLGAGATAGARHWLKTRRKTPVG